jgi:UDP-2-acetamido-2,6-beta-L-arabino-hexul-4-ose reductase
MNVLVTGANGFIGKNLIVYLNDLGIGVITYTRENSIKDLPDLIREADCIVHLAGVNRPLDEKDFNIVNSELTSSICEVVESIGRQVPFIFASSTQAVLRNAYGKSKLDAEMLVKGLKNSTGSPVYIYRLPGVFGRWCKPNYNSVVATFCNNISHNLPIQVKDPSIELSLVYVDDVIEEFVRIIQGQQDNKKESSVWPEYKIKLGDLASQIELFRESRDSLISERVGKGLARKLYSTYVSYFDPDNPDTIAYKVK